MPSIRRILSTIVTTLTVASVVTATLPAQAQSRPAAKRFSLKKAGPKAGAGKPFQGTRAPGASGGGMTSGSSGMTSQSKGSSSSNKSGSMSNRSPNRSRK